MKPTTVDTLVRPGLHVVAAVALVLFTGCAQNAPANTAECGNGKIETDEQCDDGNTVAGDGCSATCQFEASPNCGNSIIDPGEDCDDGNTIAGDGCSVTCQFEASPDCGNATLDPGEECDDGNTVAGDGCDETCHLEAVPDCGDGTIDTGEECDDGTGNSDTVPDACRMNCFKAWCGDGIVDTGEDCDPPSTATCDASCLDLGPSCGDGTCDAGEDVGSCPADCPVTCGDAICSPGENVNNCPADCSVTCGDAICSLGENVNNCPADCSVTCGDAICSLGEDVNSCPADCPVTCGDGICSPSENASTCAQDCPVTCGDGVCSTSENASTCSQDCPVTCGDGICSPGENVGNCAADCPIVCGDTICSSTENNNNCPSDCNPFCGNSVLESGEQCDPPDGSTCDSACQLIATCTITGNISTLGGVSTTGSNATGNDAVDAGCGYNPGTEAIYTFTPSITGNYVVSLDNPGSDHDTIISVRASSCPAGAEVACNDDFASLLSQATFAATAGTTYYIIVEGYNGSTGNFELTVHRESVCEGVAPVTNITSTFTSATTTVNTTTGVSALAGVCGGGSSPEGMVSFTAPRTGAMVASTNFPATNYDTRIYVREGDCDAWGSELDCNDDDYQSAYGSSVRSQVEFNVTAGETYYLMVDAFGSGSGIAEVGVGYGGLSPFDGSTGACGYGIAPDLYRVFVSAGDSLHVVADTISSSTAADLCVQILDTDGTTQIGSGDDNFACTYPPPSYSCPDTTVTVNNTGFVYVRVNQCSTSCATPTNNEYELTVTRNGAAAILMATDDN